MAFLDKLGEKISSGANAVSDSAKKMAESNKLNAKISSYLEEINIRYTNIGRAVKLRLMDSIQDQEVLRLAAEVDVLLAEVNQMQEQINNLKGVKYCSNCGTSLSASVLFCPNCGTKQEQSVPAAEPAPAVQPTVSEPAPVAQPTVSEPAPVEQPAPEPEPAPAAEPAAAVIPDTSKPQFVFCTNCGNKENSDMKFCSECGTKL